MGKTKKLKIEKKALKPQHPEFFDKKKVYFNGEFQHFFLYLRKNLNPGNHLKIPSIVISDEATLIIDKTFNAQVDEYSNIILQRRHL